MFQTYLLSSTFDGALVSLNKLIPLFKNKYSIEKLSLITLTDVHANSVSNTIVDRLIQIVNKHVDTSFPIKDKNKTYTYKKKLTTMLLLEIIIKRLHYLLIKMLKSKYNLTAVGHIVKFKNVLGCILMIIKLMTIKVIFSVTCC